MWQNIGRGTTAFPLEAPNGLQYSFTNSNTSGLSLFSTVPARLSLQVGGSNTAIVNGTQIMTPGRGSAAAAVIGAWPDIEVGGARAPASSTQARPGQVKSQ